MPPKGKKPASRSVVAEEEAEDEVMADANAENEEEELFAEEEEAGGSHDSDRLDEDNDEDDDHIVAELPVYVSGQLHDLLFMFQYPTRKHPPPNPLGVRVKPLGQRFELDIPIDTSSDHYDANKGEELGVGLDNEAILTAYDVHRQRSNANSSVFQPKIQKILDKQVFASSIVPATSGTYMVAAVRDEEVHMTPLTATVQLRPTLKYLDKLHDKEKAATQRIQQEEAALESGGNVQEEEAKVFQMTFRQADDKEGMKRAKLGEERRIYENEEWAPFTYFPEHTREAGNEYERLFSIGDDVATLTRPFEYLEEIGPKIKPDIKSVVDGGKIKLQLGIPLDTIKSLPFIYQPKALLINANILQHSKIESLLSPLPESIQDADLIAELEKVAVFVRGAWVIRSEILYSGRVADARRLLLQKFQLSDSGVTRKEVNEVAKLPHPIISNLFIEIAARVDGDAVDELDQTEVDERSLQGGKWMLKTGEDAEFIANFPEVFERQKKVVAEEARRARLALEASRPKSRSPPRKRGPLSAASPSQGPSSLTSSPSARASAPGRQNSSSSTSSTASTPLPAVKGPLITNYNLVGSTASNQLENLIRSILMAHGVASAEHICAVVSHKKAEQDVANSLLQDVTKGEILALISQNCVQLHGRYALKSLNSPSIDEFRKPVLELFKTKESVKKSEVTQACQTVVGKAPPQNIYSKIMKELANSTGAAWELKPSP